MSDPYAPSSTYPPPAPPYAAPQIPQQYLPPGQVPQETPRLDEPYAHWGLRVVATIVDTVLMIPFAVGIVIGLVMVADTSSVTVDDLGNVTDASANAWTWTGVAIIGVSYLAMMIFGVWNSIVRQGKRGASIGKASMNLMVVSEHDGRPIGPMMTLVRQLVHLVDQLPFYLGYLWPLWDSKRQTFADMIMKTAVLHLPPLPPQRRETGVKAW